MQPEIIQHDSSDKLLTFVHGNSKRTTFGHCPATTEGYKNSVPEFISHNTNCGDILWKEYSWSAAEAATFCEYLTSETSKSPSGELAVLMARNTSKESLYASILMRIFIVTFKQKPLHTRSRTWPRSTVDKVQAHPWLIRQPTDSKFMENILN